MPHRPITMPAAIQCPRLPSNHPFLSRWPPWPPLQPIIVRRLWLFSVPDQFVRTRITRSPSYRMAGRTPIQAVGIRRPFRIRVTNSCRRHRARPMTNRCPLAGRSVSIHTDAGTTWIISPGRRIGRNPLRSLRAGRSAGTRGDVSTTSITTRGRRRGSGRTVNG